MNQLVHVTIFDILLDGGLHRIPDGALESFLGTVDEIDLDGNKVRVVVSMFGRETPVELELDQVEPANCLHRILIAGVGVDHIPVRVVRHPRHPLKAPMSRPISSPARCSECKQRNYNTFKNKKNTPDRLELNKYCPFCRKHTVHNETK